MKQHPNPRKSAGAGYTGRPVPLKELELIEQVRAGHAEAYRELVLKYQDRVFNACWRICGHLDDAQDVTQEAFLTAWERLESFRGQSGFYTWIFRIAVNLALSRRRKNVRQKTLSLGQLKEAAGTQASELTHRVSMDPNGNPGRRAEDAELQKSLLAALHGMDDDHRAVIVLRDIEGMNYQEIGDILDIPPGTVRSRLHRGRAALRAALCADEPDRQTDTAS